MRDDIYGALKNALEHGSSLPQAMKSLLSVGYPDKDIKEAAQALERGILPYETQASAVPVRSALQPPQSPQSSQAPISLLPVGSVARPQASRLPMRPQQNTRFVPALQSPPVRSYPYQQPSLMQQGSIQVRSHYQRPSLLIIALSVILLASVIAFGLSLIFRAEIAQFLQQYLT